MEILWKKYVQMPFPITWDEIRLRFACTTLVMGAIRLRFACMTLVMGAIYDSCYGNNICNEYTAFLYYLYLTCG